MFANKNEFYKIIDNIIDNINCELNVKEKKINKLPHELETGNKEYKYKLTDNYNEMKYQKLATQMKYRLNEGNGKAIYIIGVTDNGIPCGISQNDVVISLIKILKIIKIINAEIRKVNIYIGLEGLILTIRLYIKIVNNDLSIL